MTTLLNVDRAIELILKDLSAKGPEELSILEALGRITAVDVVAPMSLPPFANSALDGFAVRAADTQQASEKEPGSLPVTLDIAAGSQAARALEAGEAARIMTGAPLPDGADAIIPVEDTDIDWEPGDEVPLPEAIHFTKSVQSGQGVRGIGESIQEGQIVLEKGMVLHSAAIGMLAGLGLGEVTVTQQPRVTIISSGNELTPLHEPLTPGKIHDSNSYSLAMLVKQYGGIPTRLPIARDSLDSIRQTFAAALDGHADMIISSAGVSVGTADLIRTVLDELGDIDFWRINLRPGKPLAYGNLRGIPFFGLPGNPVSAMVTFEVLVRPALRRLAGTHDRELHTTAIAGERITTDGRRSYERVTLKRKDNKWVATLTGTQSSGALMSMVLADALMIVPEGITIVEPGTELPIKLLRQPKI